MGTDKDLNEISYINESETEKIFKYFGFTSNKLDKDPKYKKNKCPDFLFVKGNNKLLCEVKTINSAGYDKKFGHKSITMHNKKDKEGVFEIHPNKIIKIIEDKLVEAITQKISLVNHDSQFRKLPYLVAIYFDFFADKYFLIKDFINKYPEVSAVIKSFKDCDRGNKLNKFSTKELESILKGDKKVNLPEEESTPHWHFIINPKANIHINPEVIGICKYDKYFL